MKAYHGSHLSNLKNLTYQEENSRFGGDANLVHGAGIYFTLSKDEAKAYATASLYTVEITGPIFDATDKEVLNNYILQMLSSWGVSLEIVNHPTIQNLIKQTVKGETSGVIFARSLADIFSNEISLYQEVLKSHFKDDIDELYKNTESFFNYSFVKVFHKGNQTYWVICLNHDGVGIEILEEEINSDQ